jgi:hypothetical protein
LPRCWSLRWNVNIWYFALKKNQVSAYRFR